MAQSATQEAVSPVQAALEKAKQSQVMDDSEEGMILEGHPATLGDGDEEGDDKDGKGAAPEGDDGQPASKKTPPDQDLKYKDLEAANKAAQEAAKKMHAATEEAAQLRKDVEALKSQNEELQQKIVERVSELTEEENEALIEKTLKEMRELDPTDDGYEKSMAKLWRKVFGHNEKSQAKALKEAVKEIFNQELSAKTKEEREKQARLDRWNTGNRRAADAGLDMEDEEETENGKIIRSEDYLKFWSLVNDHAPEELPDSEKFDWAIKKMKGKRTAQSNRKAEKEKEVRNLQEKRMPLGRGAQGPSGTTDDTPPAPRSLNEALGRVRERRRI